MSSIMQALEQHAKDFFASTHYSDANGVLDAPIDWGAAKDLDVDPEEEADSITQEDENLEGKNQYSGAAGHASEASSYAKTNPSQKNHNTARVAHLQAGKLAQVEGKHKEAGMHRSAAIQHASAMRVTPLRDSITVEEDDNPEGINQFTKGGGSSMHEARGLSEHAGSLSEKADRHRGGANTKAGLAKEAAHERAAAQAHVAAARAHQVLGNQQQAEHHAQMVREHGQRLNAVNEKHKASRDSITTTSGLATGPQESITEYGKVLFADPKNSKYPLDTSEQARSASTFWGQPKNKAKYSEADQAVISKRIDSAERTFKLGKYAKGN
jgi:hypothetical protein